MAVCQQDLNGDGGSPIFLIYLGFWLYLHRLAFEDIQIQDIADI